MFERFTDRARRVVVLAQEEARLLDHNYIGTEHLLLGLIHEGEGVAAHALADLGISLGAVRNELEEIIGRGPRAPSGHIPFTPRAKKVLEESLREALQLGHNYIGTEHILLGMIREGEGVAAQVLTKLGADLARVRQVVIQRLSGYPGGAVENVLGVRGHEVFEQPRSITTVRPPTGPGVRPVRCGFCDVPSPECGTLFTGSAGALICINCVRTAANLPSTSGPGPARMRGPGPPWARSQPEAVEELAARVEATGPPPDDEEAARRAITDAFLNTMEVGADGRTLINVEDGAALADCAEQIRTRFASMAARTTSTVDHIKFLDATTAAVWLTTLVDGRPPASGLVQRECRAVFVDGRWKVSRDSMCESWRYAGIECPPR